MSTDLLQQWFRPGPLLRTLLVDIDLRVGGRYRVTMQNPEQQTDTVGGIYQTIEPPSKLVFTWLWEGEATNLETLVTIQFVEHAECETEVILTHSGFAQQLVALPSNSRVTVIWSTGKAHWLN